MYEVIGLEDFGTWLRKGEKCFCPDNLALSLSRRGHLKILSYHLSSPTHRWNTEITIKNLKHQVMALNMKIKAYENHIKKVKKWNVKTVKN